MSLIVFVLTVDLVRKQSSLFDRLLSFGMSVIAELLIYY